MRFLMIVKASPASEAGQMPSEDLLNAMQTYNKQLMDAGVLLDLNGLQPTSKGARVHFANGQRTVTDGPFAETKELIGGYWLIQVNSKQEAIDWALQAPAPHGEHADGEIELRQILDVETAPSAAAGRRFMLIVKAGPDCEAGHDPSPRLLDAIQAFNRKLIERGVLLETSRLHPSSKGARIHFSGGRRTVLDGPFAETKELIGGYWMIQAGSKQEAIDWALQAPAPDGENPEAEIEIRPVFELEDFAPSPAVDRARELGVQSRGRE